MFKDYIVSDSKLFLSSISSLNRSETFGLELRSRSSIILRSSLIVLIPLSLFSNLSKSLTSLAVLDDGLTKWHQSVHAAI